MSDERLRKYYATTEVGVDVEIKADSWEDAVYKVKEQWVNAGPVRLTMREYTEVGFQSSLINTDYPS